MQMHGAFGETGGARRVQPEGGVIFAGRLQLEPWLSGEQLVEADRAGDRSAVDDQVLQIGQLIARERGELRHERLADDRDRGPRVVEYVAVVLALQQCVRRDRHGPDLLGAEEAIDKGRRIQQQEHDALLTPNTE